MFTSCYCNPRVYDKLEMAYVDGLAELWAQKEREEREKKKKVNF